MADKTADVVVPVLNEIEMLPEFLRRVEALGLPLNLIVVDNGSTDGTLDLLRGRPEITLIEHGRNLGYGRSLADGMQAARADRVVIIDADCEYPPEAIPALLERLDRAPAVYASRFLSGEPLDMSRLRQSGNRLLSAIFNLLYRRRLTDLYTGMKALRRSSYEFDPASSMSWSWPRDWSCGGMPSTRWRRPMRPGGRGAPRCVTCPSFSRP
jgi:glycosyltransferase involved in cell wall biosynthesis